MKVICKKNYIDDELATEVGLPENGFRNYHSITPGNEYIVLGLAYNPSKKYHAGKPFVDVRNDNGDLSSVPLYLFEVSDETVSMYWQMRFSGDLLTFYPDSFYRYEYYHEDLADGVPEIKADFERLCQKFEQESNGAKH